MSNKKSFYFFRFFHIFSNHFLPEIFPRINSSGDEGNTEYLYFDDTYKLRGCASYSRLRVIFANWSLG